MDYMRKFVVSSVAGAALIAASYSFLKATKWMEDVFESQEAKNARLEELRRKKAEEDEYFKNMRPEQIESDQEPGWDASIKRQFVRQNLKNSAFYEGTVDSYHRRDLNHPQSTSGK
eukprot:TRINITY_DN12284_c0_g1_i1.p1 TRINITY_DN12284_c0_g1~~TRINITY_DN12284_c0_g1_i1.p1  ORF type:complete len:116 (-),score=18.98 TRINITY_DN12284_c0_g1_i1:126-473(-)